MPNTISLPGDLQTPLGNSLKDPTKIQQRIFPESQFFLSEYLLRGPIDTPSGTVEYQIAKLDDQGYAEIGDVQDVEPDAVYPRLDGSQEDTSYGGTNQYGAEFKITYPAIRKNRENDLLRGSKWLRNHMVRDDVRRLDAVFRAAATAHNRTVTTAADARWDVEGAAYDALTAALGEAGDGVDYDTLILNKRDAYKLAAVRDIKEATRYTDTKATSPVYNSPLSRLDGLVGFENVVIHPNWVQGQALAVARGEAGFVGENLPLEVVSIDDPKHEAVWVRGRKEAAPFIDVPQAFTLFTGIFG